MKVGLLVNVNNFTVDPGTLGEAVEEAGFDSLWVGDHPIIPYVRRRCPRVPEDLKTAKAEMVAECEKIDRDPAEIEISVFEYDKADRVEAQEMLGAYEEAGADRVVSIQGLGDRMGSNEGVGWAPETFRDQLASAVERYL
jgi:hypothetical protein